MKVLIITLLITLSVNIYTQELFNKYFEQGVIRVDFNLSGNDQSEEVFLIQIKKEPLWGGSKVNLIDTFNFGEFKYSVFDSISGQLIYSGGFCTLFQEWQATLEAEKIKRSFYETVTFPFPIASVRLEIAKRNKSGVFNNIFELYINPKDIFIKTDMVKADTDRIRYNGEPDKNLDIAFLPDGYTRSEMKKFRSDVNRFAGYLFSDPAFAEFKDKINIWAVMAPSDESGTDIPGDGIWKNTVLNTSFYTFGSDRYLTTFDIRSVRDLAANVPYDQIYILVNTDIYGGGGVYNYYSLTSTDNYSSKEVFLHEFGHGLAGLADEYYTSEVSVEDYYDLKLEPWEANITTLVDFDSKWKNMLDKNTPVPTPMSEKYLRKVGVFEGAGYSAKGIYRSYSDCMMMSLGALEGFCPVCRKTIALKIKFLTD
ncbi:MAG: M64 family metallopeptidase [Bacteroidota bacterium]